MLSVLCGVPTDLSPKKPAFLLHALAVTGVRGSFDCRMISKSRAWRLDSWVFCEPWSKLLKWGLVALLQALHIPSSSKELLTMAYVRTRVGTVAAQLFRLIHCLEVQRRHREVEPHRVGLQACLKVQAS